MTDNPFFDRETLHVRPDGAGRDPADTSMRSLPHGSAIQAAIDAVAARGGGTVILRAGEYLLTDSIRLRSDVRLIGDGEVTLRRAEKLAISELLCDVDVGQFVFTPADPSLFRPGMGICFHDDRRGWSHRTDPLTVTAVRDGHVHLHEMNLSDRLAEDGAVAVNYFPLVLGVRADRALVENLVLDGGVEDRPPINTLRTAGLYLYRSRSCTIRGITSRNVRGDGICFGKASVHTLVEDCRTHDNTNYGIHPGSHSARCTVRRCRIDRNGSDGLYICWGIHHSLFEENDIHDNGRLLWRSGISIGHKDTDNLIARNRIHGNAKFGICVRTKTAANGAHRNIFRENVIENNGHDPAAMPAFIQRLPARELVSCGVYVNGVTDALTFERNVIRETRPQDQRWQRHAMIVEEQVTDITLRDNDIAPHPDVPILDRRTAPAGDPSAVTIPADAVAG